MSLFGLSPGPSFEASFGWPKYGPNPNRNFKSVGAVRLPTGPIFFFFFFFFLWCSRGRDVSAVPPLRDGCCGGEAVL